MSKQSMRVAPYRPTPLACVLLHDATQGADYQDLIFQEAKIPLSNMWAPIISYVDLDDHLRKFCTSFESALLEAWQANEGLCRCLGDKTSHNMAYQRICYY